MCKGALGSRPVKPRGRSEERKGEMGGRGDSGV